MEQQNGLTAGQTSLPQRRASFWQRLTCLQGDVGGLPVGERLDAEVVPRPGFQVPHGAAVGTVAGAGGPAAGGPSVLGASRQVEVAGVGRGAPAQPGAPRGHAALRQIGAAARSLPARGLRRERAGRALRQPSAAVPPPGWPRCRPRGKPTFAALLTSLSASTVHRASPAP